MYEYGAAPLPLERQKSSIHLDFCLSVLHTCEVTNGYSRYRTVANVARYDVEPWALHMYRKRNFMGLVYDRFISERQKMPLPDLNLPLGLEHGVGDQNIVQPFQPVGLLVAVGTWVAVWVVAATHSTGAGNGSQIRTLSESTPVLITRACRANTQVSTEYVTCSAQSDGAARAYQK